MKSLKRVVSSMIVCVFALSMAMGSYASAYTQKRGACTRCGTENTSFGYDPNFRNQSDVRGPGNVCEYCNKIVPAGESHFYITVYDRYGFICEGQKCSHLSYPNRRYYLPFINTRKDHKITYI